MNQLIWECPEIKRSATLTTESSASSYGIPVLRLCDENGTRDCGPADIGWGAFAGAIVAKALDMGVLSPEIRDAAISFLQQAPNIWSPEELKKLARGKNGGWPLTDLSGGAGRGRYIKMADEVDA